MRNVSRRRFLAGTAGVGVAGTFLQCANISWSELVFAAKERPLAPGSRILVLVTLYGGNDGLNTVIPLDDPAYMDARADLAYAPGEVIQLDDRYGLNPGLAGLARLYDSGNLAIVRGVGYPKPDRSHFQSMDIWQSASLDNSVVTGWIGRWLDATGSDPVHALHLGSVLPRLAAGVNCSAAAFDRRSVPPPPWGELMSALSDPDARDTSTMRMVCDSYRAAVKVNQELAPAFTNNDASPIGDLGSQLDVVAACINAEVPTRVFSVQLGGFDTHADERKTQEALLQVLDQALIDFNNKISASRHKKNTIVMAYSEFGRRVAANSSDGTDHGTAGPVFVLGERVKGGFYSDDPSLTDLANDDLKVTTDFRDIYHELLVRGLGADSEPILGKGRKEIGFLKA